MKTMTTITMTTIIETVTLDEAFLDVTGSTSLFGPGDTIKQRVQREVAGSSPVLDKGRVKVVVFIESNEDKYRKKMVLF